MFFTSTRAPFTNLRTSQASELLLLLAAAAAKMGLVISFFFAAACNDGLPQAPNPPKHHELLKQG
jgi:hypothetical protein